jgi:peptidoglycan/LPS O-acetylase OafA/YrhL
MAKDDRQDPPEAPAAALTLPDRPRIDALTGIRAVAALWVLLHHYYRDFAACVPQISFLGPLAESGLLGVDLFFFLSGFIIAYHYADSVSALEPRSYLRYVWLRFARVYPLHLAVMLALAVMVWAADRRDLDYEAGSYAASDFWLKIGLVDAWGTTNKFSWNIPSWSVSAEWLAYLFVFPLAAAAVRRIKSAPALLAAAAAFALAWPAIYPYVAGTRFEFSVRVVCEFTAGCLLYRLYETGEDRKWRWTWIEYVAPAAVVVAVYYMPASRHRPALYFWLTPVFGAAVYVLAFSRGPLSRLLAGRAAVYLGEISYALYLTHTVIRKPLKVFLPAAGVESPFARTGVFMVYVIVPLIAAALAYHLIEKPCRNRMRNWFKG